jgi:hypothetical protein
MIRNGQRPGEGSDRLSADQWQHVCGLAAVSDFFDAWLFIILGWNLMSRAGTTAGVRYSWLSWDVDHIVIDIPCHKGDPTGETGQPMKSLYANPLKPSLCFFLALGVSILSRSFEGGTGLIFATHATESSFNDWLRKVSFNGTHNSSHLTAHSTRKGAASYLSSLPGCSSRACDRKQKEETK